MPLRQLACALVVLAPLLPAACGGDDGPLPNDGDAQAGQGGSVGQAGEGAGAADPKCVRAPDSSSAVVAPLVDHCAQVSCPATVAESAEAALAFCSNTFPPRITIGCGTITVDDSDFSGGSSYTFDATTMQLIGIRTSSDVPYGECHVNEYRYGEFGPDCPEATTCSPCDGAKKGVAEAAETAGAAGMASSSPCPSF